MGEKNDDPAPQISLEEINEVVGFLKSAVAELEDSIGKFTPSGIQAMDEDELNMYQGKVREANRLFSGLLFVGQKPQTIEEVGEWDTCRSERWTMGHVRWTTGAWTPDIASKCSEPSSTSEIGAARKLLGGLSGCV